ncbi:MAG: TlpA disulfide reductase family protein [Smithellaceae bacterium]|nr:TlpA disulfide reductase family protein [Smithellaceae bacterium]
MKRMWILVLVLLMLIGVEPTLHAFPNIFGDLAKKAGTKAPDFALKDLSGKIFRLSDYKGKPVLIIFTTTWCDYCREELPYYKEIHARYASQGLEVINIDIQESWLRVVRYSARYQLPYRILLDPDGGVAEDYDIPGVPTAVLIDKNGKILCEPCLALDGYLRIMFKKS